MAQTAVTFSDVFDDSDGDAPKGQSIHHIRANSSIMQLKKILVANRGEIPIRIFRTAHELSLHTIAVFSYEDRLSMHRQKADEAYVIGKRGQYTPVGAYLAGDEIIKIAVEHGAQMIHPGYGFLSENAGFARNVEKAGLIFVGPSPDVIDSLGDKVSARKLAIAADVPVVPGTEGAVATFEEVKTFTDQYGFPIIIKAAYGGGGRGMRVVREQESLKESFERATSVQRRHQKVVEIAPAKDLPVETRDAILADAVKLAKSVNYRNAGTAEFLVDQQNRYYFIEINPRIQVEHTITEEITGIDIVAAQIQIAAGATLEQLGLTQDRISTRGFAIQCRITTEDPVKAVHKAGGVVEAVACYSGDMLVCTFFLFNPNKKYNLQYYLDLVDKLVALDIHVLGIKDMAGVLKPHAATLLIGAIREKYPDLPIHVHTHDSAGTGVASMVACAKAGADAVDAATDSLSGMTSQPSINAILASLEGSDLDPGLNPAHVRALDTYWSQLRLLYSPFEAHLAGPDPEVYEHEIPGGQLTNMMFQAQQLGLGTQWAETKKAYEHANDLLGDIVKVTPTSKVVGDLAQFMVSNKLSPEDVKARAGELDFPGSVLEFLEGMMGQPFGGFPEPLRSDALRGRRKLDARPGLSLEPVDFVKVKRELGKNQNRAQKLLSYLGDVAVNGSRIKGQVGEPKFKGDIIQPILLNPDGSKLDTSAPATKGWRQILLDQGPKAFAKAVREYKGCLLMDTTWRDAHQSLLATRVRTVDLLNIAHETSHALSNLYSLECWGGATFDVAMRFLYEDPWDRLRRMRKLVPNIPFQMLLRGANGVAYSSLPDNAIEQFVDQAKKCGVDIFRVFDALNDVSQIEVGVKAVHKAGGVVEAVACYSGDMLVCTNPNKKYNLQYYLDLVDKLVALDIHVLGIKDMAGVLKPHAATLLIGAIREKYPDLPIHVHTHDSAGTGVASMVACAKAGADAVDAATDSLSGMTSQPSINAILASLEGSDLDPGLNPAHVRALDTYWSQLRLLYSPFEAHLAGPDPEVYEHEIPGGQLTNMMFQAQQLGLGTQWAETKKAYEHANDLLGDIVKVTPTSKVVGDLAQFMVSNKLSPEDVKARAGELDFPGSVLEFLEGMMGQPFGGFPEPLRSDALRGRRKLDARPAVLSLE
ncbi:hypothetical protein BN1723_014727, partial [Verticillium longisporum]